jgi:hypothetical protein
MTRKTSIYIEYTAAHDKGMMLKQKEYNKNIRIDKNGSGEGWELSWTEILANPNYTNSY